MPLRLLRYERGYLPEPLGLLHSSSFPHIAILRAGYDVWHNQTGFQVLAWEVGAVAKAVNWVIQERLLSVVVKRFLRFLNGCHVPKEQ